MKWLRKLIAPPKSQHSGMSIPAPDIRDTVPTSTLRGRTLVSLWAAYWSSDTGNMALFAYELDHGTFALFPEQPARTSFLECCLINLDQSFTLIPQVTHGRVNDTRVIGCEISDLLVPCDPSNRFPDSQILLMSSGYGIAQESGTPIGILPSLYLTEGIDEDMISMFATREWEQYQESGKMA